MEINEVPTRQEPAAGTTGPPVRRLWSAVLCGYLAFGATLQALPGYVIERFTGGTVAAGWAVGIAFAATALGRPWAGRAGDAGRSRPVVLAGGLLIALGALGHLLAPDLAVLLLARVVMGAGEAAVFSAALPWVLTGTPPERRGRVAGWFGLSMWGGLAAGPLVAIAAGSGGPRAVWWTVLGLGLACALLVVTTGPQPVHEDRPAFRPRGLRDLVPAGAVLPGLGLGLSAYGYGTVTTLLVLYLTSGGHGGQNAALAVFAGAFLVTRWLGSPRVDRHGGTRVAFVVLTIESAGLLLVARSPDPVTALPGAALVGVGLSLMFPATVAMTLARSGPVRPGVSVGLTTSFWDLGILVAGPTAGLISAHVGDRAAFLTAAAAAALALVVTFALRRGAAPRKIGCGACASGLRSGT
ncbi:MFS transporter [Actinoallomurus iriomotensis]|uniref:Major facilitator superfamily (MFS) profile domain-containing protein n=1 Tax=Actinoallomurus iriomotensis TaxID=478107 RepID=A0A9W6VM30_9ACTN|nr:MFS transporter [Actinoallomurus iriomotensis]GLY72264.1 hypothetical protein Airi01_005310 [Actinoallomurus iriomotensis]